METLGNILKTIVSPATTAGAPGSVFRDVLVALGTLLAVAGAIGFMSQGQVDSFQGIIKVLSDNSPLIVSAVGVLVGVATSIYRAVFLSNSDKAQAVANATDKLAPGNTPVILQTPGDGPNASITVNTEGKVKTLEVSDAQAKKM